MKRKEKKMNELVGKTIPITIEAVKFSKNYEDDPDVRRVVTITDTEGNNWKSWSAKLFMAIPKGTRMIVEHGKQVGWIKVPREKKYTTKSWSASKEMAKISKEIADAEFDGNEPAVMNAAMMELARVRGYLEERKR